MEEEEDKEVQQLVKRLAEFLGLELVEKRMFYYKYLAIRDKRWRERTVWIQGHPASCISWKDALCKLLGAENFKVYRDPEDEVLKVRALQIANPFFEMSPEEACLYLDLHQDEMRR